VFSVEMIAACDAVVISDYNKGYVSHELIELIITACRPKPIFIDTKKTDLGQFTDCFIKINALEHSRATSLPMCKQLIVTQGDGGAVWDGQVFRPDTTVPVADVTGAGDTFLSALAYKYLETKNMQSAINFANTAASITVQHVGVYAPRLEEIL
jgi:D-beta-D-heptose 7-phosphate kinase/D-beta-D-heptose 1-phosphate adenosyltransferase